MIGVARIAVAAEHCQWTNSATKCRCLALDDQIGCAFAQVDAIAMRIKRTAQLGVEDHERVEPIEVQTRKTFATSCHYALEESLTHHLDAHGDGVGCRRTGGGDGIDEGKLAEAARDVERGGAAVVVVVLNRAIGADRGFDLGAVHAADGGSRKQCHRGIVVGTGETCLLQGFAQGKTADEGGAALRCFGIGGHADTRHELVERELDFTDEHVAMHRVEVLHGGDT